MARSAARTIGSSSASSTLMVIARAPAVAPSTRQPAADGPARTVPPVRRARSAMPVQAASSTGCGHPGQRVHDLDLERGRRPRHRDVDRLRGAVLRRVGERLLDDPVRSPVDLLRHGARRARDVDGDLEPECLRLTREFRQRAQSRLGRRTRGVAVQRAEHAIELAHRAPPGRLDVHECLARRVDGAAGLEHGAPRAGLQQHRRHAVPDGVVKLEGERRAVSDECLARAEILFGLEQLEPALRLGLQLLPRVQEGAEQPHGEVRDGDRDQRHGIGIPAREGAESDHAHSDQCEGGERPAHSPLRGDREQGEQRRHGADAVLVAEPRVDEQRDQQHAEHQHRRPAPEGERERLERHQQDRQRVVRAEAAGRRLLARKLGESQRQGADGGGDVPPQRWRAAQRRDEPR